MHRKRNKDDHQNRIPALDWSNEGDVAYRGAEWIGAVLFYCLNWGGKRDFSFFLSDAFTLRNALAGTFLQLAAVVLIVFVLLSWG